MWQFGCLCFFSSLCSHDSDAQCAAPCFPLFPSTVPSLSLLLSCMRFAEAMRICSITHRLITLLFGLQEHVKEGRVLWDQPHWQQDQRSVQEHNHGGSNAAILWAGGGGRRYGEADLLWKYSNIPNIEIQTEALLYIITLLPLGGICEYRKESLTKSAPTHPASQTLMFPVLPWILTKRFRTLWAHMIKHTKYSQF